MKQLYESSLVNQNNKLTWENVLSNLEETQREGRALKIENAGIKRELSNERK